MVPKDTSFPHYIWPTYKVLISKYTIKNESSDLWWSNLEPMQVELFGGQIWKKNASVLN